MYEELPVYEVEELSEEEAMRLLAAQDNTCLGTDKEREACAAA